MAKGNSVVIKIDGDDSGYKKTLEGIAKTTKAGMADIKAGIDLAVASMQNLAAVAEKGVNYNATIEQMKTSFEVMTGSAEKAADVVDRLRVMGAETPFEFTDLAKTTQLLMQYGFTADDAIDRMRMLGDIAQGNKEAMNSIAMGYAQMSSAGKVNLQDIKQMINGGFNPLQEISERTGESMADLYDRISDGEMKVSEITESMKHATSEGGKFFQSMEKQSQTLNGQLSTLKDNADQLLGSLTEGVSEGLRDQMLPFANNLVAELQGAFDAGGYQGLVDTATDMIPDLLGMMTGELQKGIEGLTRWLPKGATKLMQALPSALRAGATVTPQITQALFEVAGQIVNELIYMLPELAPAVLNGLEDMFGSVLSGTASLIENMFYGIDRMLHKGQTKVAGAWVDDEKIAEFKFDLDTDITPAEKSIQSAYDDIREALNTDLLTDDQRNEILGMIGDDYETIKQKLMSFGMEEDEAEALATTITAAGGIIKDKIDALDIGVDSGTVLKWIAQAGGSRLRLKSAMKKAGLSQEDQNEVIGVFDTMMENITGALPNVIDEIFDTLTNGKIEDDDPKSLKDKLDEAYQQDLAEIDKWLEENIGELDDKSDTYASDVAALSEEAAGYKAELGVLHGQMVALVESLAGQPTEVVEARMGELAAIQERIAEINEYINATMEKARHAEQDAYRVVRAGANANTETITAAFEFANVEFKLNEQEAQDAYDAAVAELNAQLASREITSEEYDTEIEAKTAELEAAKAAAMQTYDEMLAEIFGGIAESEGASAAIEEAAKKINLRDALDALNTELANQFGSNKIGDQLGDEFTQMLAEKMGIKPEMLKDKTIDEVRGAIDGWMVDLVYETQDAVEGIDAEKLQAAYEAALQQGLLSDTAFDAKEPEDKITALFKGIFENSAEQSLQDAQAAGETVMNGAGEGAKESGALGTDKGGDFGSGYVSAIRSWANAAYSAAYTLAKSAEEGIADGQESASPSKVAMGLGRDFGDGYSIGLQESMARAASIARRMSGGIATAAEITRSMRVNVPSLQQDIVLANEQSDRNVNLYVNGRQLGRVMAADNQAAQNSYNRNVALGVGK